MSFNPADPLSETCTRSKLEACIDDMKTGMLQNKLKLNDDKSEFMIIASKNLTTKIRIESIHIRCVNVPTICIYL